MPASPPTTMTFQFNDPINESVQIGDVVYYCPNIGHGGFSTVNNNIAGTGIVRVGLVTNISITAGGLYQLVVMITNQNNLTTPSTLTSQQAIDIVVGYNAGDFIMFSKDTETNRNSLLGYYAEVRLGNDSPGVAELFAISTEASESSK